MNEPRLIKKYPNRRLYDTELSCYITLNDVRALIAAGHELKVSEQRGGRDITRNVLLQVISEQEAGADSRLSREFLTQLIRSYRVIPAIEVQRSLEACLQQMAAGRP
jgi:polyhydroxyalkanoate synthesis repressor PhaR